jgi:hypothetical protein
MQRKLLLHTLSRLASGESCDAGLWPQAKAAPNFVQNHQKKSKN